MAEVDLDVFDALVRINTRATFIVNREAARHLRNGGAIVNLTSSADSSSLTAYGLYAATKAATDVLTRALAIELRERDITVNAVCIEVDTSCAPHRVADVVAYLLSDQATASPATCSGSAIRGMKPRRCHKDPSGRHG